MSHEVLVPEKHWNTEQIFEDSPDEVQEGKNRITTNITTRTGGEKSRTHPECTEANNHVERSIGCGNRKYVEELGMTPNQAAKEEGKRQLRETDKEIK